MSSTKLGDIWRVTSKMVEKFEGTAGRKNLTSQMLKQCLVKGDINLAEVICNNCILHEYEANQDLITQGQEDSGIYFVVSGSVSIRKNDKPIDYYRSGNHVGELSTIDISYPRAATVRALEKTVVVYVAEPVFSELADKNPILWRRLALECAERLRSRGNLVSIKNPVPVLFVGSSVESLPVAREIEQALSYDKIRVKIWTNAFTPSSHPMEDLQRESEGADFAVLVLGEDDLVFSREDVSAAPRDNVIFELGFFMGALSRQRVYMVKPRGCDLKLPSDLNGLNPIEYISDKSRPLSECVSPACNELRKTIATLGAM